MQLGFQPRSYGRESDLCCALAHEIELRHRGASVAESLVDICYHMTRIFLTRKIASKGWWDLNPPLVHESAGEKMLTAFSMGIC